MLQSFPLPVRFLGFALLLALLALAVPGCINPPEYPDTPQIEFRDIKLLRVDNQSGVYDSINITIGYRDGDGDLGLDATGGNNYFCQLQIQRPGGTFVDFSSPGFNGNSDGRFPNLTPVSQEDRKAPIRGDINYGIRLSFTTALVPGDVLRYRVSIEDRTPNRSNEVFTSPITLQP